MSTMESGLTVAVTGAGGYIAGRLIDALEVDDRVSRILGFDVRPPSALGSKLVFDEFDVRNPALEKRLEGADVLVHLAFIMDPIKDEHLMRDVNVNGSHNVFASAGKSGVRKIVYTSSATVYGAHPDNDIPLTEDSPLRANLDFSYPAHKLEVEYIVKEFREAFPQSTVTIFRPAIVFGPNVDNAWSHFLEFPVVFGVRGYEPLWQFVHESDVAAALRFAILEADLDGPFNLAPADWMTTQHTLDILGRQRRDMSEAAAFALTDRFWNLGVSEAPAGMLHYVMHSWVVSPEKLANAGFACSRTSEAAFAEAAALSRGHVRVGRKRVSKTDLTRGAAAGIGLVGAAAAMKRARKRPA